MVLLLMDYMYLISATVISLYNRKKAKTRQEKKKYGSQAIFIIFFTISGYLIGFLLNLPAIELCVLPVVLKLFVELQDSQIYTDALTRLCTRTRRSITGIWVISSMNLCGSRPALNSRQFPMRSFG